MNAIAIIIAGIIQINNLYLLFACRIIQGIIVGCNMAIVPIYIHELTPNALLGVFGVFTQLYVIVAVVVSYTFGVIFYYTGVDGGFVWRFMFSFTGITCLIQSILLVTNVILNLQYKKEKGCFLIKKSIFAQDHVQIPKYIQIKPNVR